MQPNQSWQGWAVRLYKAGRSLQVFGFDALFNNVKLYAEHLAKGRANLTFHSSAINKQCEVLSRWTKMAAKDKKNASSADKADRKSDGASSSSSSADDSTTKVTTSEGEEYEVPSQLLAKCSNPTAELPCESWELLLEALDGANSTDYRSLPWSRRVEANGCSFLVDVNRLDAIHAAASSIGFAPLVNACKAHAKSLQKDELIKAKRVFAWKDVLEHQTQADCWVVVDSKVYDVTTFLPKHPGKLQLLQGLGVGASALFEINHRTNTAFELLNRHFIGLLSDPENMPKFKTRLESDAKSDSSLNTSTSSNNSSSSCTAARSQASEAFFERLRGFTKRIQAFDLS